MDSARLYNPNPHSPSLLCFLFLMEAAGRRDQPPAMPTLGSRPTTSHAHSPVPSPGKALGQTLPVSCTPHRHPTCRLNAPIRQSWKLSFKSFRNLPKQHWPLASNMWSAACFQSPRGPTIGSALGQGLGPQSSKFPQNFLVLSRNPQMKPFPPRRNLYRKPLHS